MLELVAIHWFSSPFSGQLV